MNWIEWFDKWLTRIARAVYLFGGLSLIGWTIYAVISALLAK